MKCHWRRDEPGRRARLPDPACQVSDRRSGRTWRRHAHKNLFVGSAIQSMRPRLQLSVELPAVPGQATIQPDHRISGCLTQRYVKRHGTAWKSAEICHLCGYPSPHFGLRFRDDFWGWNADRIPELFIGEVVLPEQVDVAP